MAVTLANRLAHLICEIKEIEKILIFERVEKEKNAMNIQKKWELLGKKISTKWDKISAIDEIRDQREKKW